MRFYLAIDNNLLQPLVFLQLIRRWDLGILSPAHGSAIYCHNYSVRAISAGSLETLVSADSSGEVAVWKI